jgi:hypothetical protein
MQQHLLKEHYWSLLHRAQETSAEWYVYRHAAALLGGTGDLIWIRDELKKERAACLRYAERDGTLYDAVYGTYGTYMRTKKKLYDEVIRNVLICYYETLAQDADIREDHRTQLSRSLIQLLQEYSPAQASAVIRQLALSCAFHSHRQSDRRQRKVLRKRAAIYAQVALDLGGTLH